METTRLPATARAKSSGAMWPAPSAAAYLYGRVLAVVRAVQLHDGSLVPVDGSADNRVSGKPVSRPGSCLLSRRQARNDISARQRGPPSAPSGLVPAGVFVG